MTEALAKMITVHVVLFFLRHRRIVLFPEGNCSKIQHAAPVCADFVEDEIVLADVAKGVEFVEAHVGRCDGLYFPARQHLFDLFELLAVEVAE